MVHPSRASSPDVLDEKNPAMRAFVTFSRAMTGLAFAVLMASVLIQVVGRLIGNSPVWTEELTRFALLFMAAFGAGLSLRSGDLVNVDIVCEALPGRWPWRLRLFAALMTGVLCLIIIEPTWQFMSIGALQTSPALSWRMDFIYVSMVVMVLSLLGFAALRMFEMLSGRSDGQPERSGDDAP